MIIFFFSEAVLVVLVFFFMIFTAYEVITSAKGKKARCSALDADNNGSDVQKNSKKFSIQKSEQILRNYLDLSLTGKSVEIEQADRIPFVSIMLPVCNEINVLDRLLDHVLRIVYFKHRLEILVLDDSNETNAVKVKEITEKYISSGKTDIHYLRREEHRGFKAGNLCFGLTKASGDLIAFFDADSMPQEDFLLKTVPYFMEADGDSSNQTDQQSPNQQLDLQDQCLNKTGFLQTVIAFRNNNKNFITRFLALEVSHKDDMTRGLSKEDNFVSLTGSSCIWRRKCLDNAGGPSSRTLTEDVDLCCTAQIGGWQYQYVTDTVTYEDLPETISALRVQRHRWAYGMIKNAFIHAGQIAGADFSFGKKIKAFIMMAQNFILAGFYAVMLLVLPLAVYAEECGILFYITCPVFLVTSIIWAINTMGGNGTTDSKQKNTQENPERQKSVKKVSLFEYICYVFMYFPLALYYFTALFKVIFGLSEKFIPTPKKGGTVLWVKTNIVLFALEIFSLIYSLVTVYISLCCGNYWTLFYASLTASGFLITILLALNEFYTVKKLT